MAEEGIRALARALPAIAAKSDDREPRTEALYGAWLCGVCLGTVGMALHHKLCHTLGGTFDLPHAEMHTIVLSHSLAYNAPAVPQVMARIGRAMGVANAAQGLDDLAGRLIADELLKRRVIIPNELSALALIEVDGLSFARIEDRSQTQRSQAGRATTSSSVLSLRRRQGFGLFHLHAVAEAK